MSEINELTPQQLIMTLQRRGDWLEKRTQELEAEREHLLTALQTMRDECGCIDCPYVPQKEQTTDAGKASLARLQAAERVVGAVKMYLCCYAPDCKDAWETLKDTLADYEEAKRDG